MASITGLQATALQPELAPGLGAQEAEAATPKLLLSWANGTLSGPLASGLVHTCPTSAPRGDPTLPLPGSGLPEDSASSQL